MRDFKIKTKHPVSELFEYQLFMSWKKVKLGDVCETASGGTPSRINELYWNGSIPWLKSGELNDGLVSDVEEYITEEGLKNSSAKLVRKGTLLLALYGATAGKLGILGFDSSTNQALCAITPIDECLDNRFLMYFLFFKREKIVTDSIGGAQPNISQAYVRNIQIPLPPLPTQKHIASILDKADALRQQNRQLLEHYDALLQSTFIEMFGDPVENPKGWEVWEVKKVVSKIESGWSPVCLEKSRQSEDVWAVLKLGAITYRVYKPSENKELPLGVNGRKELAVKSGDLLFSRKNTRNLVGATVFVYETPKNLMIPDTVFRLKYNENINPLYFLHLFNERDFKKTIQNLSSGSSGSMPNISKEKLFNFLVPLPPLELQQHFAKIVEEVESQKQQAQATLAESEALFQGLLAGYFGEN